MRQHKFHKIREIAKAHWNCPVSICKGNQEPKLQGEASHYETKGGQIIWHPSAYSKVGWSNMLYCNSTLHVTVGIEWIASNQPEIFAQMAAERLL